MDDISVVMSDISSFILKAFVLFLSLPSSGCLPSPSLIVLSCVPLTQSLNSPGLGPGFIDDFRGFLIFFSCGNQTGKAIPSKISKK